MAALVIPRIVGVAEAAWGGLARTTAVAAGPPLSGLSESARPALGPPICCGSQCGWPRLDRAFDGFRVAAVSNINLGPCWAALTPSGSCR